MSQFSALPAPTPNAPPDAHVEAFTAPSALPAPSAPALPDNSQPQAYTAEAELPVASPVSHDTTPSVSIVSVSPPPSQAAAAPYQQVPAPYYATPVSAPAPTPATSTQQCATCHSSSTIQVPPNLPVGALSMQWQCPNCKMQNRMSINGGQQPAGAAPVPAAPIQQSSQCNGCRNCSTIQFPSNSAPGSIVAWRCPVCQFNNQTSMMQQPQQQPMQQMGSGGQVPSGLPPISTRMCGRCSRSSTIGLPAMVSPGTRAVSWKCPSCNNDNDVPLAATISPQQQQQQKPMMYEQYHSHQPPPQQQHQQYAMQQPQYAMQQQQQPPKPALTEKSCACCHSVAAIAVPPGGGKMKWKCPKCFMMNN